MRILVVTTGSKCPTDYALRAEGWSADVWVVDPEDTFAYGQAMHKYWKDGEAFINIEHDMAPFEGAVQSLISCALDLCLYGYPRAATGSLGMIRFSQSLIAQFPNAADRWPITPWWHLEQAVLGQFQNVDKHQHRPNIAHLSGWFTND